MPLPTPNLDDRRFQDLVDEAKRYVQERCEGWTDHNVSDPGVTLIETFAWMTDLLLYRVNRIPDSVYVKFLDLIGLQLFPPASARVPLTFWLSSARDDTVVVPYGAQSATLPSGTDDPLVFETVRELPILPCDLESIGSQPVEGTASIVDARTLPASGFQVFSDRPQEGDVLLIGLSDAVPSCIVRLGFSCTVHGVGIDPTLPPLEWEAHDGREWLPCELESDTTGGFNRNGEVVVHLPDGHARSTIEGTEAGWLRCRVHQVDPDQPMYRKSPRFVEADADTVGGNVDAVNATIVRGEILGESDGTPGQTFTLDHSPVVPGDVPFEIQVERSAEGTQESALRPGWERWERVRHFADSEPGERHFVLDEASGRIEFGPAVRQPDGSLRRYGATPSTGTRIRVSEYTAGGGSRGNVRERAITVLRTSIPYVHAVENRVSAQGGVDGENIEDAKVRGPILLRSRDRAVTVEDYVHLTKEIAPEVGRVHVLTDTLSDEQGGVRVMIVPTIARNGGGIEFGQLVPEEEVLDRIRDHLDDRRPIGTRIVVSPPRYLGVTVEATVRSSRKRAPTAVEAEAIERIGHYLDPLVGGPDGTGWPFGRQVHIGDVFRVLETVDGLEYATDVNLFQVNPITDEREGPLDRIPLEPFELVFPHENTVSASPVDG